eukprot:PhF_6_TR27397/c0_g1_i1/m.40331/K14308/NUP54, NUP57; nuclear pore complex protein Nup54
MSNNKKNRNSGGGSGGSGGWGSGGSGGGGSGGWGSGGSGGGGSGGWGSGGSRNGGWGNNNQGPTKCAPIVERLLKYEHSYSDKSPSCNFRTFLYTICPSGQAQTALNAEQQRVIQAGGYIPQDLWNAANRKNPDDQRMYPIPVHFMSGLKQRADLQKQEIQKYNGCVETLRSKLREVKREQDETRLKLTRLQDESTRIQRNVLSMMTKIEVIRQNGLRLGAESTLRDTVEQLKKDLHQPNSYDSALNELEPMMQEKLHIVLSSTDDFKADDKVLSDLIEYLNGQQRGLQLLVQLMKRDKLDADFILEQSMK